MAPLASLLLDHRGTLLAANRAAQPLLQSPATFRADAMRRLHYEHAARWVPLAIPIAQFLVGGQREFNLLSPAIGACRVSFDRPSDEAQSDHVLAVVSSRALQDPERIRDTFGMSPAEARVVALLVQGKSARQTADELRIKLCTVRTHIQRALEKTRSTRQSELISKVLAPQ